MSLPKSTSLAETSASEAAVENSVVVQPREVDEYAFRAFCAAGADAYESAQGAAAVLRAVSTGDRGFELFQQLLEQTKRPRPMQATLVRRSQVAAVDTLELCNADQSSLRAALQLMDLICCGGSAPTTIAYTRDACIDGAIWDELLVRTATTLNCSVTIVTSLIGAQDDACGSGTRVRGVVDGVVAEISRKRPEAVAVAEKLVAAGGTAVIASAARAGSRPQPEPTVRPIRVDAHGWSTLTTAAREYLARDA